MSFASLTGSGGTSNILNARLRLPGWGCWSLLVTLDRGDTVFAGPVVVTFGSLILKGTVRRGQPFVGRGQYRIFGGADGWSLQVPAASYRGPETLLSTIAIDTASLVGETIVVDTNGERVIGRHSRMAGFASDVLSLYAPKKWWVELDGTTHLGDRPNLPAPSIKILDFEPDRGIVTYSDDSNFILPGQLFTNGTIAGEVSTVFYDLNGGKLRSEVYLQ